jgi:CheY-like chemotaxis protein
MDAPKDIDSLRADARKVKQIVYNLLSNAVKFAVEGGDVTLKAKRVPRAMVGRLTVAGSGRNFPLGKSEYEEFLELSVTDTGIGISPEGMERLFKPFSQIDSGLARKFEGTGLGLAMVKLLADLHCGAVAVESTVDKGSRFTVWLPYRPRDEVAVTVPNTPPRGVPITVIEGGRVALVVEDDYKSADLIRLQLEAEGFTVLHADSAEAGLAIAEQQPLALITVDIMLQNMDGWEFLSRIKQMPAVTNIPVVIISIVADPSKGFALGASAVLQKPISRQELYESLISLGLFPLAPGKALKVLVVDDDPKAIELIAARLMGLASTVLRAGGGQAAIDTACLELPDLIVLDLMMPQVSGFDVVEALHESPATARIPIVVVTAKQLTPDDRFRLNGYVTAIMDKGNFNAERFSSEIKRAISRQVVA